jgi:hypothetical protein
VLAAIGYLVQAGCSWWKLPAALFTHDSQLLIPLLDSIAPIRGRRGRPRHRPSKLHADKAYDQPTLFHAIAVLAAALISYRRLTKATK